MLESVNRLRSSPLYRRADRSVRLPFRLPRTNLLQGNYFYHRVAALWEAWALRESGEVALRTRNDRAFDSAYGMYVAAIVVRALGVLGIPLTGIERSAESPTSFVLQGADGERLELRVRNSVPAELFVGERKALQFIALPQDLSAHLSTDDFERTVHEVVPAGKEGIPTLVLYPGLLSGREQLPAHFRRLVHWTGPVPRGAALPADLVGIIPVTPLEIESTERAARALRWVLYGQSLLSGYPQRIPVPDWLVVEAADWIHRESDALRIVRKPTEAQLRQTESDIDHLHGLQPRRFGNRTEPTATGPLKQALRQAAKVLGRLATCPMCGEDRDVRFEPWESGAFRCLCRDCKGEWGTRTCVSCGNFPILLANGAGFQAALGHPEHGDDIDSAFGSELLAVPCPTDPDGNQFQCPRCGICQNAPRCDCGSTSTPTIAGDGAE
jgi:hypothetical protein